MYVKYLLIITVLIGTQNRTLGMSSDDYAAEDAQHGIRRSIEQQLFQDGYVPIGSGTSRDSSTSDDSSKSGDSYDSPRERSIFDAISAGDCDVVSQLLNARADCEQTNEYGQTPLIYAAQQMEADIVEELLTHGASLAARDDYDYAALMYAAENNDVDSIRILAEHCNRKRWKFEEQMAFSVALVVHEIDGEDNPYFGEIYSMLMEPTAILSEEAQKKTILTEILNAQKLVKQLSADLGEVISDEEYRCLPRKKLKRKKLFWLRTRYHRLLKVRDRLVAQSMAALAPSAPSVDRAEMAACFACCEAFFLPSVLLKPVACSQCSGSDMYVCRDCLPKLNGLCPFCQHAFAG